MSEPKRATLSTISTQKGDVKKVKETSKTIRFRLTLPESNEKSCPEYNYRDLLNAVEKKNKLKDKSQEVNGLNHLDPFDDDDDADVKRIARQFEEKYGIPKKKRRGKKDDYADIGAGYDESDSFIDNTDAYDEMVPEDVTTLHGGFYINSGALEFKQVELSGSDSSDSDESEKQVNHKRSLDDSEESESEEEKEKEELKTEHVEKKQKVETNGIQKPAKKKLILPDDKDALKKKKVDVDAQKKKSVTVKDLLREKREEFDMSVEPETPPKEVTKPSGSSTITDVIESVVNAVRGENTDETSKDSSSSEEVAIVSGGTSESESSRDGLPAASATDQLPVEAAKTEPEIPIVKLPENIPNNILEIINNIKKAAENSEGKVKFFSGSVNNMLLSLEINCRRLGKSTRLQIYEHLAPFVKCKKDTLMRRAKNLLLDQERSKLKDPLLRLKVIIEKIMPVIKNNYEKECQKVRDEMFLASANANADNGDVNSKVRRVPRKKFPWSEEAKKTLQEIIFIKKKCFTLEGIRKETFEENLESFLKSAVLPLWPEGWITISAIMKQTKLITETAQKPKVPKQAPPMSPITLDIHATAINPSASPFSVSPVKNVALSPTCATGVPGITVIPIPQSNITSPKPSAGNAAVNGPKLKHCPPVSVKPSDLSVSVKKNDSAPTNSTSVINMSAEICAVTNSKECTSSVPSSSLLVPSSKSSVTITSVDLRTNTSATKKEPPKEEESVSTSLKPRMLPDAPTKPQLQNPTPRPEKEECQIIDLTETPVVIRKPGPKSKTRYVDGSVKPKRVKESGEATTHREHRPVKAEEGVIQRKPEEITGTQALNHIITGLAKFGPNSSADLASNISPNIASNLAANIPQNLTANMATKASYKENQSSVVNEDDMEQVMKDLKELQQLQEHARKNDIDIMAPSSSPVSVIAFNSSYSPNRMQANDLSTSKERKVSAEGTGFQDIFQKHLFQETTLLKQQQSQSSSSVYNTNVQPKSNYNSINNFSYSTTGSISNTMNNIRYSQSSSKYTTPMNHLPTNPAGATNHNDDFALFQNFLYQYGFHSTSGSKQKSPP